MCFDILSSNKFYFLSFSVDVMLKISDLVRNYSKLGRIFSSTKNMQTIHFPKYVLIAVHA